MYPFKPGHAFVRNAWYVAALSSEVGEGLLERRILGETLIFYRSEAGQPVALSGLCPHRRMPLALGRRRGDAIECGYHGISFDAEGRCVRVPSQAHPSEQMRLRRYPVAERWQWLWIWTGDPELADPALIPDHAAMGLREDWEATPVQHYPVAARYPLLIENLLDLSHISFLHGSYIEDEAWFATPVKLTNDGTTYVASRHSPDSARSDFHTWMFPDAPERIDQNLRTVFLGPGLIYSGPVVSEAAGEGRNGRYLGTMYAIHALTPETKHSTHYFSTTTRDFRQGDAAMTQDLHGMDIGVRMQDVVALSAIEQHLESDAVLPLEISVPADTPCAPHSSRHRDDDRARDGNQLIYVTSKSDLVWSKADLTSPALLVIDGLRRRTVVQLGERAWRGSASHIAARIEQETGARLWCETLGVSKPPKSLKSQNW